MNSGHSSERQKGKVNQSQPNPTPDCVKTPNFRVNQTKVRKVS
jgi:hypothetical protein